MASVFLFDLDGTLVDSIELIVRSARFAFEGFGGRAPTDDEWRAGIGRPLLTMLREYAPAEGEAEQLLVRFREYQLEHHDALVSAFEGIVPLVLELAAAGHPMALVTSKADWLAARALRHVGLDAAIPVVVGCDTCDNHKPHPEPVHRALGLLGAAPADALFVGDSPHDIEAGRAAGVQTVGVTWGAFAREEIVACGPDLLVDDVHALRQAMLAFHGNSA